MKKYLFIAGAALLMAVSCAKVNGPSQGEIEDDSLVPIRFGSAVTVVKSKAQGALAGVDEKTGWNGQTVYIYGVDRKAAAFDAVETTDGCREVIYIDNVAGTAPIPLDPSAPGYDEDAWKRGQLTLEDPSTPGQPFYYKGDRTYDFYGYYVDDAASGVPVVAANTITVPVTLTGSQDIMIAKANPQADIDAVYPDPEDPLRFSEKNAYSARASRRRVDPKLVFEHQLSRFLFYIQAGNDLENTLNVIVDGISINSVAEGNLVVASLDEATAPRGLKPVEGAAMVDLALGERNDAGEIVALGTKALEEARALDPEVDPATVGINPTATATQIGESLMVFPVEGTYALKVSLRQGGVAGTGTSFVDEYVLDPTKLTGEGAVAGTTAFVAGKQYKVTLKIYGLQKIKIEVEVTDWVPGGEIECDPDVLEV